MRNQTFGPRITLAIAVSACVLAFSTTARAAITSMVDFEDPPYTDGQNVDGQDGWNTRTWCLPGDPFGCELGNPDAGDSTITSTSPLAGSQSLAYTNGPDNNFDDINRGGWFSGAPTSDGTAAPDVTVSWLMKADSVPGRDSIGLYVGGPGLVGVGFSPAYVRLHDGQIQYIEGGSGFVNGTPAGYDLGDVMSLVIAFDLDNQQYEVFAENITDGTPQASITGGTVSVFDPGFQVGDEVSIGLALRNGINGSSLVDNIQIEIDGIIIPEPGTLVLLLLAAPVGMLCGRRSHV